MILIPQKVKKKNYSNSEEAYAWVFQKTNLINFLLTNYDTIFPLEFIMLRSLILISFSLITTAFWSTPRKFSYWRPWTSMDNLSTCIRTLIIQTENWRWVVKCTNYNLQMHGHGIPPNLNWRCISFQRVFATVHQGQ